jgi:TRAP-type transport system periplasmic protein
VTSRRKSHRTLVRCAIVVSIAACVGTAWSAAACAQTPPQITAPEWKLSTALGPAYPQGRAGAIWAELIRARSGGRLKVSVFPGATLVQRDPSREFLGLRDGAIDLAVGSTAAWALQVKELNLIALPWLVPDGDALDRLLRGEVAARLSAAVEAAGAIPLAWAADGFRELATRRPVRVPADLDGLPVRVAPSPLLLDTLQALGAAPVSMDAAGAVTAQRRGALDGEEITVAAYAASRAYATGFSRLLLWGAHADAMIFAINRTIWQHLSENDRDLVMQAARDAAAEAAAMARKLSDPAALGELSREGVTVTRLTPSGKRQFRDTARAVYERWAAVIGVDLVQSAEAALGAPR